MKKLFGSLAVLCLLVVLSISVFSKDPFKTNVDMAKAGVQALQILRPGDALIKKSDKKSAINVLFIDYCPIKPDILKVDIYDSKDNLLASQTENVKKINEIATACIYVDASANTQDVFAVLNGAGFENKHIAYAKN